MNSFSELEVLCWTYLEIMWLLHKRKEPSTITILDEQVTDETENLLCEGHIDGHWWKKLIQLLSRNSIYWKSSIVRHQEITDKCQVVA